MNDDDEEIKVLEQKIATKQNEIAAQEAMEKLEVISQKEPDPNTGPDELKTEIDEIKKFLKACITLQDDPRVLKEHVAFLLNIERVSPEMMQLMGYQTMMEEKFKAFEFRLFELKEDQTIIQIIDDKADRALHEAKWLNRKIMGAIGMVIVVLPTSVIAFFELFL